MSAIEGSNAMITVDPLISNASTIPPPANGVNPESKPSAQVTAAIHSNETSVLEPAASNGTAISAGSKRSLTTKDKDGNQLSEKKLRRLAKNRLSARECRRRKREATENLQRQINVMEGENLRLRLQLQIGEEAEESITKEQTKLTEEIDDLLKSGASEAEIYAALESFKEKYADYGRDRRSAIEFHLRNIERLLMPTQTTSVIMRAIEGGSQHPAAESSKISASPKVATADTSLEGVTNATSATSTSPLGEAQPTSTDTATLPDKATTTSVAAVAAATTTATDTATTASAAPENPISMVSPASSVGTTDSNGSLREPKSLFQRLVNHLDVTPEQAAALKDSRFVAQELDGCLEKALVVVKELRDRLAQTGEDLETQFNNVRNVLTPTQAAKFLVWVANNSAAMHMLNELWDRIYPSNGVAAASTAADADADEAEDSPEDEVSDGTAE